jgi:hypothetical protein
MDQLTPNEASKEINLHSIANVAQQSQDKQRAGYTIIIVIQNMRCGPYPNKKDFQEGKRATLLQRYVYSDIITLNNGHGDGKRRHYY